MPAKTKRTHKNLVGQVFGRLTVINEAHPSSKITSKGYIQIQRRWNCICKCGNTKTIPADSLIGGSSNSCGCLYLENASRINRTHGLNGTPEQKIWEAIKQRCFRDTPYAANYKDRGITMCDGWQKDLAAFVTAVGRRPSSKHTIDRKNNDGNYSCGACLQCVKNGWPMNVWWRTRREQLLNTRRTRFLTINDETLPMSVWTERQGFKPNVIPARLRLGWKVEQAVKTPVGHKRISD